MNIIKNEMHKKEKTIQPNGEERAPENLSRPELKNGRHAAFLRRIKGKDS